MKKIGIGLMASGKSVRMGENKLLMTIQGKTMIEHMIEKLVNLKTEADKKSSEKLKQKEKQQQELKDIAYQLEIVVVSSYVEIFDIAEKHHFTTIYNHKADLGQSESIKLITAKLLSCEGIVFLPCDQIFIQWESIHNLIQTFIYENSEFPTQVSCKGKRSSPVIFPKKYYKDLLKLTGDKGGKILLENKKVNLVEIHEKEQLDLDTKNDIEKAMKH